MIKENYFKNIEVRNISCRDIEPVNLYVYDEIDEIRKIMSRQIYPETEQMFAIDEQNNKKNNLFVCEKNEDKILFVNLSEIKNFGMNTRHYNRLLRLQQLVTMEHFDSVSVLISGKIFSENNNTILNWSSGNKLEDYQFCPNIEIFYDLELPSKESYKVLIKVLNESDSIYSLEPNICNIFRSVGELHNKNIDGKDLIIINTINYLKENKPEQLIKILIESNNSEERLFEIFKIAKNLGDNQKAKNIQERIGNKLLHKILQFDIDLINTSELNNLQTVTAEDFRGINENQSKQIIRKMISLEQKTANNIFNTTKGKAKISHLILKNEHYDKIIEIAVNDTYKNIEKNLAIKYSKNQDKLLSIKWQLDMDGIPLSVMHMAKDLTISANKKFNKNLDEFIPRSYDDPRSRFLNSEQLKEVVQNISMSPTYQLYLNYYENGVFKQKEHRELEFRDFKKILAETYAINIKKIEQFEDLKFVMCDKKNNDNNKNILLLKEALHYLKAKNNKLGLQYNENYKLMIDYKKELKNIISHNEKKIELEIKIANLDKIMKEIKNEQELIKDELILRTEKIYNFYKESFNNLKLTGNLKINNFSGLKDSKPDFIEKTRMISASRYFIEHNLNITIAARTTSKKFIYTLNEKLEMVFCLENGYFSQNKTRPSHSELAGGLNVYGAGEIAFTLTDKGTYEISEINNGSGHYRPDPLSLMPVAQILKRDGFNVDCTQIKNCLARFGKIAGGKKINRDISVVSNDDSKFHSDISSDKKIHFNIDSFISTFKFVTSHLSTSPVFDITKIEKNRIQINTRQTHLINLNS